VNAVGNAASAPAAAFRVAEEGSQKARLIASGHKIRGRCGGAVDIGVDVRRTNLAEPTMLRSIPF